MSTHSSRRRARRRLYGALGAGLAGVLAISTLSGMSGSAGAAPPAPGAPAPGGYWTATAEQPRAQKDGHDSRVAPRSYEGYTLDRGALATALDAAPLERRGGEPATISVPAPTGELVEFAVVESPVMESGLAARNPDLRTFAGRATGDPTATIRLDLTPSGFHAAVRGSGERAVWYVDPAYNGDDSLYLSYRGNALPAPQKALVEPELDESQFEHEGPDAGEAPGAVVSLRTYRLALVTDPSYATYFGTANVLAEKVTLINRVNHVYGDDLAIKLVLIDDTPKLNLDTAAKAIEPNGPCGSAPCFSQANLSSCTGAALTRNRLVVGQLVGASNYDIGHLALGNPGGGVASAGVGGDGKARGCTGLPTPEGDFFAVDYVAHEMGHQFGGPHTFNGTQANCSGGNRSAGSSVEPGSGSSVMAYAGICQQDNIQPHSDPYFSQRSVTSISTFVTNAPVAINEVQNVSLYGFDTDGESFTLTVGGTETAAIVRGTNYTVTDIDAAIEVITGADSVTVAAWGGSGTLNDTGFQVTFNGAPLAGADQPSLILNPTSGDVTGFTGETARGGLTNPGGQTVTPTGNHAPSATAPEDKTIPVRTPFALTGSATDVDGDALVHIWEQNDRGGATGTALGNAVKLDGPLFRIFSQYAPVTPAGTLQIESPGENLAGSSPTRAFPDLAQIAAGNTNQATTDCPAMPAPPASGGATNVPVPIIECYAESLPTLDYVGNALAPNDEPSLNFRFTARDLAPEGGGYAYDDVKLTIDKVTGPFTVSSKNNPVSAAAVAGRTETISWSANTTALSPNVRITFSTDGGLTFPHVLAETTPNDGSALVTWPELTTTKGRIRIEAVENYFFDLNNTDIEVIDLTPGPGPGPGPGPVPETTITGGPADGAVLQGRSATYALASSVAGSTFVCSLNGSPVTCSGTSASLSGLASGTYTFRAAAKTAAGQSDPTPATRTFTVPMDDDVLSQKGDWTEVRAAKSFDGDYLRSSDKGAMLKYQIKDALGVTLVVSTGKNFGPVKVMLGNTLLKQVPLRGKNQALRLKNIATFDTPRSGKLRIVVAKNKQVRIEGLAIITA